MVVEPVATATPPQTAAQLEASGALLALDRSSSLAGTDGDTNGIRDDIDRYLAAQSYSSSEKRAVEQLAKGLQRTLTINVSDQAGLASARLALSRGIHCVFLRLPTNGSPARPLEAVETVQKLTFNTKSRVMASIDFDNANDGTVVSQLEGDTCE